MTPTTNSNEKGLREAAWVPDFYVRKSVAHPDWFAVVRVYTEQEVAICTTKEWAEHARAALDAVAMKAAGIGPPAAPGVPEGWKLVPAQPTHEMVQAGALVVKNNLPFHTGTLDIYRAMLVASPSAPE